MLAHPGRQLGLALLGNITFVTVRERLYLDRHLLRKGISTLSVALRVIVGWSTYGISSNATAVVSAMGTRL
jgi:hypothetical protein